MSKMSANELKIERAAQTLALNCIKIHNGILRKNHRKRLHGLQSIIIFFFCQALFFKKLRIYTRTNSNKFTGGAFPEW